MIKISFLKKIRNASKLVFGRAVPGIATLGHTSLVRLLCGILFSYINLKEHICLKGQLAQPKGTRHFDAIQNPSKGEEYEQQRLTKQRKEPSQ